MPTISVIVPVYKVEPYIHQCIDSILAQTYTDFELILVDDGSPDNCGLICDEYAKQDNRIRVIHQENQGLSAARNAGIDIAKGEYLTFIDSDDWVGNYYLEYLYRASVQSHCKMSVCQLKRTFERRTSEESQQCCGYTKCDGLTLYMNDRVIGAIACCKLYHKSLFDYIRFPVNRYHEDEFVAYKLLDSAGDVAYIDEPLYYYFVNSEGIMRKPYSLKRLDALIAFEEACVYFKKHKRKDVLDFVRRQLIDAYCSALINLKSVSHRGSQAIKVRLKLQFRLLSWGPSLNLTPFSAKWNYSYAFPVCYRIFVFARKALFTFSHCHKG